MDALMPEFTHGVSVIAGNIPHIYVTIDVDEVSNRAAFNLREVLHLLR